MTRRAIRKKQAKKFKVGDVITWGHKFVAHTVVQVVTTGVWVAFAPSGKDYGPPVHTSMKSDYPLWRIPLHPNFKKS